MKRTACEEAADYWEYRGRLDVAKQLRAEGRELKRLRKLVVDGARPLAKEPALKWMQDMDREARRILKARKK